MAVSQIFIHPRYLQLWGSAFCLIPAQMVHRLPTQHGRTMELYLDTTHQQLVPTDKLTSLSAPDTAWQAHLTLKWACITMAPNHQHIRSSQTPAPSWQRHHRSFGSGCRAVQVGGPLGDIDSCRIGCLGGSRSNNTSIKNVAWCEVPLCSRG